MIQKLSPSKQSQTGVTRGRPELRPVVSRRASPDGGMPSLNASLSSGLISDLWSRCITPRTNPGCGRRRPSAIRSALSVDRVRRTPPGVVQARRDAARGRPESRRGGDDEPSWLGDHCWTMEKTARDTLIESHLPLARQLAWRYARGPDTVEDLIQVASLGLV